MEKNLCITLVIYQESLHDALQQNMKYEIIKLNEIAQISIRNLLFIH